MMLMTPSVPATSISRRLRVPSKTLMLALFHAKQVIPKREKRKKKIVKKYVGVQSWKAAHLPTLEIRVEQKRRLQMQKRGDHGVLKIRA